MNHSPLPWTLGEFGEYSGYDCMTGGVRAGPAMLDGCHYGQGSCATIAPEALATMMGDAALIVRAVNCHQELVDMLTAAEVALCELHVKTGWVGTEQVIEGARAALARAKGEV